MQDQVTPVWLRSALMQEEEETHSTSCIHSQTRDIV